MQNTIINTTKAALASPFGRKFPLRPPDCPRKLGSERCQSHPLTGNCGYETETSIHASQEKNLNAPRPIAAGKKYQPPLNRQAPPRSRRAKKTLVESVAGAAKKIFKPKSAAKAAEPKTEVTAETLVRRTYTRRKKTEIPPILLEGDAPEPPPVSGPGEKFSLGPTPPVQNFPTAESELPEAYGTKKLFLTARDPHWLYAHWDLTREQQLKLNAQSSDGHLVLRIYAHKIEGHPTYEIHVHPESRHWFTHVERAGNSYVAELGYYSALGKWTRVSTSSGTMTPPDAVSAETDAEFATIPFEFPFAKLLELIKAAVCENLPLAQALEELRRNGYPDLPRVTASASVPLPAKWTPQQEQALAKIINIDAVRRVWMGSLEITELIRRRSRTRFPRSAPRNSAFPVCPVRSAACQRKKISGSTSTRN